MKFALLIGLVLLVLWLWGGRKRGTPPPTKPARPEDSPQKMLVCATCGVHLPKDEALPGRGGVFCSEAHRQTFERDQPGG